MALGFSGHRRRWIMAHLRWEGCGNPVDLSADRGETEAEVEPAPSLLPSWTGQSARLQSPQGGPARRRIRAFSLQLLPRGPARLWPWLRPQGEPLSSGSVGPDVLSSWHQG